MQVTKNIRRRINISTSVKGVKTWDVTVEMVAPMEVCAERDEAIFPPSFDQGNAAILAESDALVASMEARYPIDPAAK